MFWAETWNTEKSNHRHTNQVSGGHRALILVFLKLFFSIQQIFLDLMNNIEKNELLKGML